VHLNVWHPSYFLTLHAMFYSKRHFRPGLNSCIFGNTTSSRYNLEDINFIVSVPWGAVFVWCTSKV